MQHLNKSKAGTGVFFALFLGQLGIHDFYLGRRKQGLGHVALFAISSITLIVSIFSAASRGRVVIVESDGDFFASQPDFSGLFLPFLFIAVFIAIVNIVWALFEVAKISTVSSDDSRSQLAQMPNSSNSHVQTSRVSEKDDNAMNENSVQDSQNPWA